MTVHLPACVPRGLRNLPSPVPAAGSSILRAARCPSHTRSSCGCNSGTADTLNGHVLGRQTQPSPQTWSRWSLSIVNTIIMIANVRHQALVMALPKSRAEVLFVDAALTSTLSTSIWSRRSHESALRRCLPICCCILDTMRYGDLRRDACTTTFFLPETSDRLAILYLFHQQAALSSMTSAA